MPLDFVNTISACAIETASNGMAVCDILDGFSHLTAGSAQYTMPLTPAEVALIHYEGGSILRTSRQSHMQPAAI